MPTPDTTQTARRWHATCLVVGPEPDRGGGAGSVSELIESLIRRELTVRRCTNSYDAMAELVLHERVCRNQPRSDPLVVVLVDPPTMPNAPSLFDAGVRHAPRAIFWEFQSGPASKLAAYRPAPAVPSRKPVMSHFGPLVSPSPPEPERASPARPLLRLTDDREEPIARAGDPATSDRACANESGALVLSDEELSMLLGEGPSGRSRGSGA